jgi:hypothetical protein
MLLTICVPVTALQVFPSVDSSPSGSTISGKTDINVDWYVSTITGVRIYPVDFKRNEEYINDFKRLKYLPLALYFTEDVPVHVKGAAYNSRVDSSDKKIKFDILTPHYINNVSTSNKFIKMVKEHQSNGYTLGSNPWIDYSGGKGSASPNDGLVDKLFGSNKDTNSEILDDYIKYIQSAFAGNSLLTSFLSDFTQVDGSGNRTIQRDWALCIEPIITIHPPNKLTGGNSYWFSGTEYAKVMYDLAKLYEPNLEGLNDILPYESRKISEITYNKYWFNYGVRFAWAKSLVIKGAGNTYMLNDVMRPKLHNDDGRVGGFSLIYVQDIANTTSVVRSVKIGGLMDLNADGTWKYNTNSATFAEGLPEDINTITALYNNPFASLVGAVDNPSLQEALNIVQDKSVMTLLSSPVKMKMGNSSRAVLLGSNNFSDYVQEGKLTIGMSSYRYTKSNNLSYTSVSFTSLDDYHEKTMSELMSNEPYKDADITAFAFGYITFKDALLPSGFAIGTANLKVGNTSNMTNKIAASFTNLKPKMTKDTLESGFYIGQGKFNFESADVFNTIRSGIQSYVNELKETDNKKAVTASGLPAGDISVGTRFATIGLEEVIPNGEAVFSSKLFSALWANISSGLNVIPLASSVTVKNALGADVTVSKYTGAIPVIFAIKTQVTRVPFKISWSMLRENGVTQTVGTKNGNFPVNGVVPISPRHANLPSNANTFVIGWSDPTKAKSPTDIGKLIANACKTSGVYDYKLVNESSVKTATGADFVKKVPADTLVQGVCSMTGGKFNGFEAVIMEVENPDLTKVDATEADINQQELSKWWGNLAKSGGLSSVSPSVSLPSCGDCSGHTCTHDDGYSHTNYHSTTHSVNNWSYSVKQNMTSAKDILGYVLSGEWSKTGTSLGITSVTPNMSFMLARSSDAFDDLPTNANWVQSLPTYLQGLGFKGGLSPNGTRISGTPNSSTIKNAYDTVSVSDFTSSVSFHHSYGCGSKDTSGTLSVTDLPSYGIATTLDKWTPKTIVPAPADATENDIQTGAFNNGELWFTDVSNSKLHVRPEVLMKYQSSSGGAWVNNYMMGETMRDFYPTGYFSVALSSSGDGKIDSDTVAVDNRARALQSKIAGFSGSPVIYSGGNLRVAANNNFKFTLTSYTMDISTNTNGHNLKQAWGNTTYNSEDVHSSFATKVESVLSPNMYINVNGKEYQMNTRYTPAKSTNPILSDSYNIKFHNGVVTDWDGLPNDLRTGGARSMRIEETLKQALESKSGSNPVGWYNEDTTGVVVNKYTSTFTVNSVTASDKLNITWGPKAPSNRNNLFSNGYGAFITYKVLLKNNYVPTPFTGSQQNAKPIISGELPNTRFIIPDASINDMRY